MGDIVDDDWLAEVFAEMGTGPEGANLISHTTCPPLPTEAETAAEQWAKIAFAPTYMVSTLGRVRSERQYILTPKPLPSGYTKVTIRGKGHNVHRLVAMAWIPNPNKKPYVDHIDGNRSNNCAINLRWATPAENASKIQSATKKAFRRVLQISGKKVVKEWPSMKDAGKAFGSEQAVSRCCRGLQKSYQGFEWKYADSHCSSAEPEEWKLSSDPSYYVSSLGRIRTLGGRIINGSKSGPYLCVRGSDGNPILCHRLVAEAFCPMAAPYLVVNHKDGNGANNRSDNLEWTTMQQNTQHAVARGKFGKHRGSSRAVLQIKPDGSIVLWSSAAEAARGIGISSPNITTACRNPPKTAGGCLWAYAPV